MPERPILFSSPMVRAILDGRKTQTRRVVKDVIPWATEWFSDASGSGLWMPNGPSTTGKGCAGGHWRPCPYGKPGDRLWVRETWRSADTLEFQTYRADIGTHRWPECVDPDNCTWRPSIFMPRHLSRITLEITRVRVERVQDISAADCEAEGISREPFKNLPHNAMRADYHHLWDSINAKRGFGWDANPWVWVLEFKRLERANG